MMRKKQFLGVALVVVLLVIAGGWGAGWVKAYSNDYYHDIQKNINLFGRVYQEITKKYVEEIDPDKFMKAGIEGMLSTLDPYTVLVEKEDNDELQIMSSGKYGGLGMRIGLRSKWPTVVEPPFDGTPASKAGIREGDRIIEVGGQSTKGMTISEVASLLRGEVGSEVFIKIQREGEEEPIEFRLIRDEIIVTDVVYSGIVRDGIGYIRLSHFSRNAGKDIEKAIRDLKRQGLRALILDLRSNPGGLLEAAVNVSENFIPKGKVIVSTEGRTPGSLQKYVSEKNPILEDLPLAVLVNGLSASASEIVSGAVQDWDRGVIIGTNTFGKGLVQTVVPLSSEAALKITTAKYLVPSGRLIQDPKKVMRSSDEVLATMSDAEKSVQNGGEQEIAPREGKTPAQSAFHTAHGREVYASHGITPDIVVQPEKLNRFELELLRKTMPFHFAVVYAAKHPELQRNFEITEEILNEFKDFLDKNNFQYKSDAEQALEEIKEIAQENDYYTVASAPIEQLQQVIQERKASEFERSKEFIRDELLREIAAKLWGTKAEMEASFKSDPVVKKALEVLSDRSTYDRILQGDTKKEKK